MNRLFTGIVTSICLFATTPLFASEQFNACVKNYSGEANKFTSCFQEIGNRALEQRKRAFEQAVSQSQQQFQQNQQQIQKQISAPLKQKDQQEATTPSQPTATTFQPIQTQPAPPPRTLRSTPSVTTQPSDQGTGQERYKPPKRIQFY